MSLAPKHLWPGVPYALISAVLFGCSTPLSKLFLDHTDPQMLAGLLYLGAGIGLSVVHLSRSALKVPVNEAPVRRRDIPWLLLVSIFGGVVGPFFLMSGLTRTSAASGSLLLNLESIATMAIAWLVFRENVDRKLLIGALTIVVGALILSWRGDELTIDIGALFIVIACIAWGIDNNLTRKLSASDPVTIAMTKGWFAGLFNCSAALVFGGQAPTLTLSLTAALLGFLAIGVSLVFFILALRHLGAARSGAYFSMAPFIGSVVAVVLGEAISLQLILAAAFMGLGLWLHLSERHEHEHSHERVEHEHRHTHDDHHQHNHDGPVLEPHSHWHEHVPLRHKHPHYPDLHHNHRH